MSADGDFSTGMQCPIPISDYPSVTLAHGGGGRLTQMLIEKLFVPSFHNTQLDELHDGARLEMNGVRLAFSTDSFVVHPLFFPGGDIGSLAVHGTVNDLAMCGARPAALSAGLILEEGLPMEDLWRIVRSMKAAAETVGVSIVTGDTKVVDRGKGDGAFVNTTGIGVMHVGVDVSPRRARAGDVVLLSGQIAVHGVAIMSVREGLEFETALESDSAPLHELVERVLEAGGDAVHVLRDPTRGGVASALNEIAAQSSVGIRLEQSSIPVREDVRSACELLGLDPLYVANEGKCLVIAEARSADSILRVMRDHPLGREAAIVGEVVDDGPGAVVLRSSIGGSRVVDMLSGEQLPRIC
jgi:hydrogenase expression/formation protein HypE